MAITFMFSGNPPSGLIQQGGMHTLTGLLDHTPGGGGKGVLLPWVSTKM